MPDLLQIFFSIPSHYSSSWKQLFLKISQDLQDNTCAVVFVVTKLQVACNFIKKETPVLVFSCEFCRISKSNFFIEHLWTATVVWKYLENISPTLTRYLLSILTCISWIMDISWAKHEYTGRKPDCEGAKSFLPRILLNKELQFTLSIFFLKIRGKLIER